MPHWPRGYDECPVALFLRRVIMIKGLAITPPVLGRISIGRVVEKNGIRLPQKDNQFTITSQIQEKGGWILHPLDEELGNDDDLGTFIFRTTGYNSIRTLAARLSYYQAVSGGLLAYMPLELKLRGKSTTQSRRTPIYYVDLVIKDGVSLQQAVAQAREKSQQVKEEGVDQAALDTAAAKGFGNALLEYDEDEITQVIEEFYPPAAGDSLPRSSSIVSKLREDLDSAKSASG